MTAIPEDIYPWLEAIYLSEEKKKQNSLAEETESDIHVRHLLKTLTEQCVSGIWDVLVAQDDSCYNVGHYVQT